MESCFGILSRSFSFGRFCVYVSVVGKNNIKTALSTKNIYCFNECKHLPLFFCQKVLVCVGRGTRDMRKSLPSQFFLTNGPCFFAGNQYAFSMLLCPA